MTEHDEMHGENELRRMLANANPVTDRPVDPQLVIARARSRRLPRQLAAGAVGVLAIAGVGVLAVNVPSLTQPTGISADQAQVMESAPNEGADAEAPMSKRLGAEALNTCGEIRATPEPSRYGLELTVQFPAVAAVSSSTIDGVVTMTNTSTETVEGVTAIGPTVTVSDGGVVVAVAAPSDYVGAMVDLQPGESLEYAASFVPASCDVGATEALPAGRYDLSGAIDFTPDGLGTDEPALADLVTGPPSQITLQ